MDERVRGESKTEEAAEKNGRGGKEKKEGYRRRVSGE